MISDDSHAYYLLLRTSAFSMPYEYIWALRNLIDSLEDWISKEVAHYMVVVGDIYETQDVRQEIIVELLEVLQEVDVRKINRLGSVLYFAARRIERRLCKCILSDD